MWQESISGSTGSKSIVSSKGQVVIPAPIRRMLGIHVGTELLFEVHNGTVEIKPIQRSIEMFFGRCKQAKRFVSVEEMDQAIMQAVKEQDQSSRDE